MRAILRLTIFSAVTTALACTSVTSDESVPSAIQFDTLPAPSVVAGDTMRDTTGAAVPLRAEVFNVNGGLLEDADVAFIATTRGYALRTVNDVLPNDYAIARPDTFADQVEIVAQVGRLQSAQHPIDVVHAPTVLRVESATDAFVRYRAGVDTNSATLRVRVGYDSAGAVQGVKSWLVRFAVVYPASAPGDTSAPAFVVVDSTSVKRSPFDTTGTDGVASRSVRIRPSKFAAATDSVVVEARATYKSALLGSPARFVVRLIPPQ